MYFLSSLTSHLQENSVAKHFGLGCFSLRKRSQNSIFSISIQHTYNPYNCMMPLMRHCGALYMTIRSSEPSGIYFRSQSMIWRSGIIDSFKVGVFGIPQLYHMQEVLCFSIMNTILYFLCGITVICSMISGKWNSLQHKIYSKPVE